jgi:hypothetical protein
MKIRSLQLKNFKRFTDLTLQGIPDDAKLVLLIGNNGSGKSSVFDGLAHFASRNYKAPVSSNDDNSKNAGSPEIRIETDHGQGNVIGGNFNTNSQIKSTGFYGRTSFRQIPRLSRTSLGSRFNIEGDSDRPATFIDRDERFENDLEHIYGRLLREYFVNNDRSKIIEEVVNPINFSFERIFGNSNGTKLRLKEIIPPLEGKVAQIKFEKGNSTFHYNYLSAGEKEVFNILINLLARREYYQDTVFFYDEIDLHLNTRLQYNFLKEIMEHWIPDTCQFWTASHSLGFIEYATDYERGCVIDLDDLDFDLPQSLSPKPKDSFEVFEIAVSKAFIDKVVQGRKIIFSENTNTPAYNDLNIENILFFVALDKNDVFYKARNHKQFGIVDRDYLSDEELLQIKKEYPFLFILPYYSFENLLYHPDNLQEYYSISKKPFDRHKYIQELTNLKNRERDYLSAGIISARSGYPYFKENDNAKKLKKFKEDFRSIIDLLRSDDLETYYKVFPAKDYGRDLEERKNIPQTELAKTQWFKQEIESTVK